MPSAPSMTKCDLLGSSSAPKLELGAHMGFGVHSDSRVHKPRATVASCGLQGKILVGGLQCP